jgi:hypothetical protein
MWSASSSHGLGPEHPNDSIILHLSFFPHSTPLRFETSIISDSPSSDVTLDYYLFKSCFRGIDGLATAHRVPHWDIQSCYLDS